MNLLFNIAQKIHTMKATLMDRTTHKGLGSIGTP
jgi:hypothetical protein